MKDVEGRSAPDLLAQGSDGPECVEPAVAAATEKGHTVEWDPPWGMTAARRWTCTRCHDAVLDYAGNVYGSAATRTCDEAYATWKAMS